MGKQKQPQQRTENQKQRYKKKQHHARKQEKKSTKKTAPKPRKRRRWEHPLSAENQGTPVEKVTKDPKTARRPTAELRAIGGDGVSRNSRGEAATTPTAPPPLWYAADGETQAKDFLRRFAGSGPARSEASHKMRVRGIILRARLAAH